MPLLSTTGRRSPRMRALIALMYVMLVLGAASMVYPLLLMLAGSVKSETDYVWATPWPRYLLDDDVLWMKYVESKYGRIGEAEKAWQEPVDSWRRLVRRPLDAGARRRVAAFDRFRRETRWPAHWYRLGHLGAGEATGHGHQGRAFRRALERRFDDVGAYSDAVGIPYRSWSQVLPPETPLDARRFSHPRGPNYEVLDDAKRAAPPADRIVVNLDGAFWHTYLRPRWPTIDDYNTAHGTAHPGYRQVLLAPRPPRAGPDRDDWEQFIRFDLNLTFVHVAEPLTPAYQAFLADQYDGRIDQLNSLWGTIHAAFDEIALPRGVPGSGRANLDYARFVRDPQRCPLDALSVYGPRQAYEAFLADRGEPVVSAALPLADLDLIDFERSRGPLRWEFVKRNYVVVLDYILRHGRGIRNTVIYCALTILATLTINPLAAYGLSRYRPPGTYQVLLFCMCTMAFPPEVTMIPSFLLLKRFPALGLAVAAVVGLGLAWLLRRRSRLPEALRGVAAGAVGLVAGFWLLPKLLGGPSTHVSLLNTFWALVLPGAANGFGIFLLKGFFDALPRELYEQAEIDGAGEWTKFWTITMSLSGPILAVLALQAFTAAYSEFMMALVIIPDPQMWTLMVWLFQLHTQVPPYVVNASLVIAAIPTFLIFLLCQNVILRGIIVPVEK